MTTTTQREAPAALGAQVKGRSWGQRLVIASGVLVASVAMIGALLVGVAWWRLGSFDRVAVDLDEAVQPPSSTSSSSDRTVARTSPRMIPTPAGSSARRHRPAHRHRHGGPHRPRGGHDVAAVHPPGPVAAHRRGRRDGEGRINAAYAEGPQVLVDTDRHQPGLRDQPLRRGRLPGLQGPGRRPRRHPPLLRPAHVRRVLRPRHPCGRLRGHGRRPGPGLRPGPPRAGAEPRRGVGVGLHRRPRPHHPPAVVHAQGPGQGVRRWG